MASLVDALHNMTGMFDTPVRRRQMPGEFHDEACKTARETLADFLAAGVDIEALEDFPPGNPFEHDLYHMGSPLGTNALLMFGNHQDQVCNYFIICNPQTGQRFKVTLRKTPAE